MVKKTQFEPESRGNRPVFVGWWRPALAMLFGYVVVGFVIMLLWWWQH